MQAFCMYVVTPGKYQQAWVTFPGCQYSMCIVTLSRKYGAVCVTALGQDKWQLVPGVSWISLCTFYLCDYNLILFTIINSISTFSDF